MTQQKKYQAKLPAGYFLRWCITGRGASWSVENANGSETVVQFQPDPKTAVERALRHINPTQPDEPTNSERAKRGAKALDVHSFQIGNDDEGHDIQLRDLFTDLMHYCDSKGIDFDDCLRVGRDNYRAER